MLAHFREPKNIVVEVEGEKLALKRGKFYATVWLIKKIYLSGFKTLQGGETTGNFLIKSNNFTARLIRPDFKKWKKGKTQWRKIFVLFSKSRKSIEVQSQS